MEFFISLDKGIFLFFNKTLSNPLLDAVVIVFTKKYMLFTLMLIGGIYAFLKGGASARWTLILAVIAFFLSDMVVYLLKGFFMRERPCRVLSEIRLLSECPESYSFPSRHAMDGFALMVVLSIGIKRYAAIFLAIASIIAFSRVYAGIHYPGDVFFGAVSGAIVAFTVYAVGKKYLWRYKEKLETKSSQ